MPPRSKAQWKTRLHELWRNWGLFFLIMLIGVTSFRSAIADWNDVPTGSMIPTILKGERIFVNRLAYDLKVPYTRLRLATWGDPKRGDVVICRSPVDGTRLVKRVIGLPGDEIAMRDNRLHINGHPISYSALSREEAMDRGGIDSPAFRYHEEQLPGRAHSIGLQPRKRALRSFDPLRIPSGSFFVMGDNRDNSADSRFFGCVERRDIMGEAKAVVVSVDPDRHWQPRWSRFFSRLD